MQRICVFCGSNFGTRPEYSQAAQEVARALVQRQLGLVYGGANVGLMGVVANAMQELGGEVIGVMPQALVDKEVANTHLSDLRIVGSMHERKAHMAELADAFIALPGGLGTMEEFFEVVTWAQLGMHEKPSGLLNIAGYYDALIQFLDHAVAERLVRQEHRDTIFVDDSAEGLLAQFETYCPPVVGKWLDR